MFNFIKKNLCGRNDTTSGTAFGNYFSSFLSKDTLSDAEFRSLVAFWLLGMDYYIIEPVSQQQANKIVLQEIMHKFPKSFFDNKRDKEWILDNTFCKK